MKREILFRGYAVEEMVNSQWLEGLAVWETKFSDEYAEEIGRKSDWYLYTESGTYQVYPESIGQYVYREDSQGNKLFEGDYFELDGEIGVIRFVDDGFKITFYGYSDIMSEGGWNEGGGAFELQYEEPIYYLRLSELTRNGNIFENKELSKLIGGA